jgi:hypothetical protein
MSADLLREAAALMRERAEAASRYEPDRWFAHDGSVIAGTAAPHQTIAPCLTYYDDAEHIASWHPAVALAVADLLLEASLDWPEYPAALAVARAYLGRES